MRVGLALLIATTLCHAQSSKELRLLAANVKDYRTKFKLVSLGVQAVDPLMKQVTSKDKRLAFESKSALRWIVNHARTAPERSRLVTALRSYCVTRNLPARRIFAAELIGDIGVGALGALGALDEMVVDDEDRVALAGVDALARTKALHRIEVGLIKNVSEPVRAAIYKAMAASGDKQFLPILMGAGRAGNVAALTGLGAMGYVEAGGVLEVQVRKGSKPAFEALARLYRTRVPKLLGEVWAMCKDDAQRLMVLDAIGEAGVTHMPLLEILSKAMASDKLRVPAQHAMLAVMEKADTKFAAPFVRLVLKDAKDRTVTIRALAGCGRCRTGALIITPHLDSRDANIRTTAIAALRDIPGKKALDALVAALGRVQEPSTQKMLLETLGRRGDPAAAPALEEWMKSDEGMAELKLAAHRAYVDIAKRSNDALARQMYLRVLNSPVREEALFGLAAVGDAYSLPAIFTLLKDEDARPSARAATIEIADRLATKPADRKSAIEAYKKAHEAGADVENKLRLLGVPVEIRARGGRVHAWWLSGPIPMYETQWKTETDVTKADWAPYTTALKHAVVDLNAHYAKNDNVIAYARAEIFLKKDREATLLCASDDGIRVWINNKLVHDKLVLRGLTPDEDKVKVTLKKGWNRLMVKCCEKGGGWGFHVRFVDEKQRGLKFRIR